MTKCLYFLDEFYLLQFFNEDINSAYTLNFVNKLLKSSKIHNESFSCFFDNYLFKMLGIYPEEFPTFWIWLIALYLL